MPHLRLDIPLEALRMRERLPHPLCQVSQRRVVRIYAVPAAVRQVGITDDGEDWAGVGRQGDQRGDQGQGFAESHGLFGGFGGGERVGGEERGGRRRAVVKGSVGGVMGRGTGGTGGLRIRWRRRRRVPDSRWGSWGDC
jgi:hypothetical protein